MPDEKIIAVAPGAPDTQHVPNTAEVADIADPMIVDASLASTREALSTAMERPEVTSFTRILPHALDWALKAKGFLYTEEPVYDPHHGEKRGGVEDIGDSLTLFGMAASDILEAVPANLSDEEQGRLQDVINAAREVQSAMETYESGMTHGRAMDNKDRQFMTDFLGYNTRNPHAQLPGPDAVAPPPADDTPSVAQKREVRHRGNVVAEAKFVKAAGSKLINAMLALGVKREAINHEEAA